MQQDLYYLFLARSTDDDRNMNVWKEIKNSSEKSGLSKKRARDGNRTRDPLLGKEVLHR